MPAAKDFVALLLCHIYEWAIAHPIQAIFNLFSLLAPGAVFRPLIWVFGVGSKGPIIGTIAARLMAYLKVITPGGLYAVLQSAAMGGYGVAKMAFATRAVAVVGTAAVTVAEK